MGRVAPVNYQNLLEKFNSLSENNSMEEIDAFGGTVRDSINFSEKKTVEYNNLVRLQDNVWDLLYKKIEIQHEGKSEK